MSNQVMNAHILFGKPCGNSASLFEVGDWAGDQLINMQKAFEAMYDSLTDMLTQEQIDSFEKLHREDLSYFALANGQDNQVEP